MSDAHKSDALLVVVTLMAAVSWIFSKEAILLMPPLLFMAARFFIAGGILVLAAWRPLSRLSPDQVGRCLGVGLVFGVAMCFWIMGLVHASSMGEGAFLTSLGVVIVPILSRFLFKEPQPASTWVAIPIAVAGLALLSLKNGFRPEPAQAFFVGAAFILALFFTLTTRTANQRTVINRRGERIEKHKVSALPLTALSLTTVSLVTLLASLVFEPWQQVLTQPPAALFGWVLASAVIGTAGRFLLQTYAQSLSAHSHGVVILILEPVWVTLFAAGWFSETMTALQMAGCTLIFAALLVNRWGMVSRAIKGWLRNQKSEKSG